jgi:hypothetical protein
MLFLAYINIVADAKLDVKSKLILFADDMVLTHPLDEEDSATKL